jgi:Family of unknown function (DUF6518)
MSDRRYSPAMDTTLRPTAKLAAIAVGSGAILGTAALLIVQFLPHPINLLGTLGGPWIATAFGVGTFARRRAWAALAGAASMAAAVTAYYFMRKFVHPGAFGGFTVGGEAINYLLLGLVIGAAFAVLGSAWRGGGFVARVVGPGLLAGALGAEVIVLSVQSWTGAELIWAAVQGCAAIAVALVLPGTRRGGRLALGIAIVSAALVGAAILATGYRPRLFG